MRNEDIRILMSTYRHIKSEKGYENNVDKRLDIATNLVRLTKREALVGDAVSAAMFAEAQSVKILLDEGTDSLNVALKFEKSVDGAKNSGWIDRHDTSGALGDIVDDSKIDAIRAWLDGISTDWAEDVEGFWSVLEIPFKIYKDNPGETMAQAKKSIFSSDERRVLESLERSDVLAKGKSRKAFR